jgi:hypothetical protein
MDKIINVLHANQVLILLNLVANVFNKLIAKLSKKIPIDVNNAMIYIMLILKRGFVK